ncbi:MAG: thymidine phosphorylase, partial [Acidimicrobiia bacterium]
VLPQAPHQSEVTAGKTGFLTSLDARRIGTAAMRLGAGRERKEDTIDPSVGIRIHRKVGDPVDEGEPLLTLLYRHPARLEESLSVLDRATRIEPEKPEVSPLVIDRIDG